MKGGPLLIGCDTGNILDDTMIKSELNDDLKITPIPGVRTKKDKYELPPLLHLQKL